MIIDHLFVIWGAPSDGWRHVIGHLIRERSAPPYRFWYERDLAAAMVQGFRLLPAFPEQRTAASPYEARYLFATFADRVPPPQRADAPAMLASWGVDHPDDQFEILAKSGGLRATDRIELAEYRDPADDLTSPLEFRIAGGKHVAPGARARLQRGTQLRFVREPANPHDATATIVATTDDGARAGYVPRQYSTMIARLLDNGVALRAVAIRELVLPDDAGRWVIRASRS
jgi:hypothetical protein